VWQPTGTAIHPPAALTPPTPDIAAEQATLGAMLIDPGAATRAMGIVREEDSTPRPTGRLPPPCRLQTTQASQSNLITVSADCAAPGGSRRSARAVPHRAHRRSSDRRARHALCQPRRREGDSAALIVAGSEIQRWAMATPMMWAGSGLPESASSQIAQRASSVTSRRLAPWSWRPSRSLTTSSATRPSSPASPPASRR